MGEPITFEMVRQGVFYDVCEGGTGIKHGAHSEAKAKAYMAYLTAEHAHGRVAQGRCNQGHLCDRDRIHMPEMLTPEQRGAIVLCGHHAATIDATGGR